MNPLICLAGIALLTLPIAIEPSFGPDPAVPSEQDELGGLLEKITELHLTNAGDSETLTVCVRLGENELLARGFGTLKNGQSLKSADADSAVPAGGLLPAFLSAAALQLSERGKLALDDDITVLCPELGETRGILVRHLLTHTSGWNSEDAAPPGTFAGDEISDGENDPHAPVLRWLAKLPIENQPGSCALIDEANIVLLGILVERVSGQTVLQFLKTSIFEPAEMDATTWVSDPGPRDCMVHLAGGRFAFDIAARLFEAPRLVSSARDIDLFLQAWSERKLIGAELFEAWSTGTQLVDGSDAGISLGATPRLLGDEFGVSFGGACSEFRAHAAYYPAFDLSVVLFGSSPGLDVLERKLSRATLDLPTFGVNDLPLSQEECAPYLGSYYSGCNQILLIERDERLVALFNDGTEHRLLYQGRHRFFAEADLDVQFEFQMEEGASPSRAASFLLREHGTVRTCVRLE